MMCVTEDSTLYTNARMRLASNRNWLLGTYRVYHLLFTFSYLPFLNLVKLHEVFSFSFP